MYCQITLMRLTLTLTVWVTMAAAAESQIRCDADTIPKPIIVSRAEWSAAEPRCPMSPHTITRITIHHTASRQSFQTSIKDKMLNLQHFSQDSSPLANGTTKPAWCDLPYHYYVAADGSIAEGRQIEYVGDTNTDYDPAGHALIVLEGNFEVEHPTERQRSALENLILWLATTRAVDPDSVKGHSDYAHTACPGKNLMELLPEIRRDLKRRLSHARP